MSFMKRIAGATVLGTALLLGLSSAEAGYVVTLQEVGSDVVATGSGSLNLAGLSFNGNGEDSARIFGAPALVVVGPVSFTNEDGYADFSGPTSFGTGGNINADSGSGNIVGISGLGGGSGNLGVPGGYVSDTDLGTSTATWLGEDFTSLGVIPGTYVWTWGPGPNQNFTVVIGPAAIPEPASAALLGSALTGLLLAGAIRRK
jgi:hypothetical protein